MKNQKNDHLKPPLDGTNSSENTTTFASLSEIHALLTLEMADFKCQLEEQLPAELVRIENLPDRDFADEAVHYLNASIDVQEQRLENLRRTKAIFVNDPTPSENDSLMALRVATPVLINAIKSGSDQGQNIAKILWALTLNEPKIDLRKSLSQLDGPIATAVAALITARIHLGAKCSTTIDFILKQGHAKPPFGESSNLAEETARFVELARIGQKKGSGGTVRCVKFAEWLWINAPE